MLIQGARRIRDAVRLAAVAAENFIPLPPRQGWGAYDANVRFCGFMSNQLLRLTEAAERAETRWHDAWVIAGRVREDALGLPDGHPDREFHSFRDGGPHLSWEPCLCRGSSETD